MDGGELVSRLIEAGLAAKYLGGADERIMGGAICVPTEELGDVYQLAFSISRSPEGWMVLVDQVGQLILEVQVSDLEQALAIVFREYG
ncbi:MAG TPA: hypothetical protein PK156_21425, partial [Polyangium sp.]|nr:hypothetical protein [Polyangium sp.]